MVSVASLLHFGMKRHDPLAQARMSYSQGNYRGALRAALDYLRERPGDEGASLLAARCCARLGLLRQAEEHYRHAGDLTLDDLQDRAYGLVLVHESEAAEALYESILRTWPENVVALKRRAALLIEKNQWKQALTLADRLVRSPSGQIDGYTLAGIAHHNLKHAEPAVAAFEQVLQIDPDLERMPLPPTLFWDHLSQALLASGRSADARVYLEKALEKTTDAGLQELLGVTYEKEGNMEAAERCWRQALSWNPDQADVLLDLGRLALGRKRWDEAVELLEKAVRLSPRAVEPVYNLGRAYRFKGEVTKAKQCEELAAALRESRRPIGGMGEMPDDLIPVGGLGNASQGVLP
jgi:tetratricopeptide (TPR) repeat protein